jgi:glucan-binding YG repeat protein
MRELRSILIFLAFTTLYGCSRSVESNTTSTTDSITTDLIIPVQAPTEKPKVSTYPESEDDTVTTIRFKEFSIRINRLILYDEENVMNQIQGDTVEIHAELGETIEGQLLSVVSGQLTDVKVEQRYQTSVTIMDEGPHCDLTEWKHFYSEWNLLNKNNQGQFTCAKYTEKDIEIFPEISIDDLKQKVKEECGPEWFKLVENIKTPTEYPSGVSISRYFLKVTGRSKSSGKTVTKVIIVETPMGC